MKKESLLLLFLCIGMVVFAQKETTVKGFVKYQPMPQKITLFSVEYGDVKDCATAVIGPDSAYYFTFVPERSGFYAVGDRNKNFPIYVKGGEDIQVDLLEDKAALTGKNTRENRALYQWEDFASDIRRQAVMKSGMRVTYKEFFPRFTEFVTKIDSVKRAINSGDPAFDELIRKKMDYDVDYYAMMFLMTPRVGRPERKDWLAFYDTIISDKKFTSDEVLQFPEGIKMISAYTGFTHRIDAPRKGEAALNNDRLRGEALLYVFSVCAKYYPDYEIFMEKNGEFLTEDQKERAKAVAAKLRPTLAGQPAKDFTYPDANGKSVSLSDFKGKVVVVDVWTTTCGSCHVEYVNLKKLEEELHGQDVVFIGVSLDKEKDKQKWIDFMKKNNFDGIQLHASGYTQIAKDYLITSVPRFMVFDKRGYVVTEYAPRPSNPRLKEMIEKELKK